ncbi:MAG: CotH kinase family protein [Phycisphaerales bacterium]
MSIAASVLLVLASFAYAETPPPNGDAGYDEAGRVYFRDSELTQITVTVAPADLSAMLADPFSNQYYECTVRIVNSQTDTLVENVGIRPRGNTSRNAVKKSWKLKFNEFVPGREVHGLEKLNLNGHQNDPSVVRGKLAWDVYNDFGVPSPRASMARLVINDGSQVDDVYANVEQIDDEFLAAWFGDDTGNLYQCAYKGARADLRYVPPGNADAYANLGSSTYELENDSGADQHVDIADFIGFIEFADDATFAGQIADRFSVDNFLRSMAVDCVNGSWDNIWYGANNFFLYANPTTGVIEYIPYDLDNTYGIDFFSTDWATRPPESFGNGGFGWDFDSSFGGGAEPPLVRRIFAIDAYYQQYLRYVRELVGAVGSPAAPAETVFADTAGDTFLGASEPHFDLLSVTLSNSQDDLFAEVRVAGPIDVGGSTDSARIVFFFDTRPGGTTSNPWGRAINTSRAADWFLGTWTDNGGGFLFYEWTGSWTLRHASFNDPAGIAQDLGDKADGLARYRVPLDSMGLVDTSVFAFDVVTTNDRGQGTEPGVDHLSNAGLATPNYDTPSQAGPYLGHILSPFEPNPGDVTDGVFTLAPRDAHIDALQAMLTPYAFRGSYSGGNADYGHDDQDFADSFTLPATFSGNAPWAWGVKPYISARTEYLRLNTPAPPPLPELFINELLASNSSVLADEDGDFDDIIEIYNASDTPIDLSGMHLSDDPGLPRMWAIPDGISIPANGFVIFWADDDIAAGPTHTNFKLSAGGETVTLSHNDDNGAVLIDQTTYAALGADESFGRFPDGSPDLRPFCAVTPAQPNDPDNTCFVPPEPTPRVFVNEWLASNDGSALDEFGEDDDFIELYNDEDTPVDLGGRFLTDSLTNPTKWEIPAGVTIPAKGRLVIWADNQPEQGPLHASFALSAGGEAVGLFDRASNQFAQIDAVSFSQQVADVSEGRAPDGSDCVATFAPSPGSFNPAGPADISDPIGTLNFFDIAGYIAIYNAADPLADLAEPLGVLNFFDIVEYINQYNNGCP